MRARVLATLFSIAAVGSATAEESPPPGFLEYLGTLVEQDGELIGPLLWEDALLEDPQPAESDVDAQSDNRPVTDAAEEGGSSA